MEIERRLESIVAIICNEDPYKDVSETNLKRAVEELLNRKVDLFCETITEFLLTSPSSSETKEFVAILKRLGEQRVDPSSSEAAAATLHPVFLGHRLYLPERLTRMMVYFVSKGKDIYKTKLNKLLFYADLTAFYLTGQGMSGATYRHLPFGPVPENYEEVISRAIESGDLTVAAVPPSNSSSLLTTKICNHEEFSREEKVLLDWILRTYGAMSSKEISDISHEEFAYRFTNLGEPIAYQYAAFLHRLPPRDLMS